VKDSFFFICYSSQDGGDIALKLADQLAAGPPSIPVWLDQRKIQPGIDHYQQVLQALRDCQGVLYIMTSDSVNPNCPCMSEWIRALKYKKPIIPLVIQPDAELPFRLEPREPILFAESFDAGLARLREHVRWRSTPEGLLYAMNERLKDARRDLASASQADKMRIEEEILQLQQQIEAQRTTIENPGAAQDRTQKNIERGLERERQPEAPVSSKVLTHFINRPPLIAPAYFQDRHVETGLIGSFLRAENMRLMTVVGRGGVGKTAMVCRLLRSLEGGMLPDDGGELNLDGIIYLSSRSGHPVNFPNLFYDLCKLLPEEKAKYLDLIYKDPRQSCKTQMEALLTEFPHGRTIILLDNFEDVVDAETQTIKDGELDEALQALLEAPPHGLKVIITTRVAPQVLLRVQPGLQDSLELDQGLKSPYAENILKAMDTGGTLGLNAPDAPLTEAREATRGFPRALEAIIGILRTDRSTNLRDLLKELKQLGSKVEDVVRDLVGEAFNRLDPLAQDVIKALAAYGAPVPAVAVDYLLQPYHIGIDSSRTLGRLVSMQFVRSEVGRFYLHQVDRDYALSRLLEGEPDDREMEPPPLTRYALRHRAAEYFKETRKHREAWKTLEDLAPQLAEFELRLAGEDYNAAASVVLEIDDYYLDLWGHYRLLVDHYERMQGRLTDPYLEWSSLSRLGYTYTRTGQYENGFRCYKHGLALARQLKSSTHEALSLINHGFFYGEVGDLANALEFNAQAITMCEKLADKNSEATARSNQASTFLDLGRFAEAAEQYELAIDLHKDARNRESECLDTFNLAIVYYNQGDDITAKDLAGNALRLARVLGYRLIESTATAILGDLMVHEGRPGDACAQYEEAIRIADDSNAVHMHMNARYGLALACLLAGDLPRARTVAEDARKFVFLSSHAKTHLLVGVIALRQNDTVVANMAFDSALSEIEPNLAGAAKAYNLAFNKALALAGLALGRDSNLTMVAAEAYHNARAISVDPGVIKDELQLLDALAIADRDKTLKPVRAVAAGEV